MCVCVILVGPSVVSDGDSERAGEEAFHFSHPLLLCCSCTTVIIFQCAGETNRDSSIFLFSRQMDAQYLKLNVNDAVVEALTSMAVSQPEDGVEYLGRYLLQYVERRQLQQHVINLTSNICFRLI